MRERMRQAGLQGNAAEEQLAIYLQQLTSQISEGTVNDLDGILNQFSKGFEESLANMGSLGNDVKSSYASLDRDIKSNQQLVSNVMLPLPAPTHSGGTN